MKRRAFLKGLMGMVASAAALPVARIANPPMWIGIDHASHAADAIAYGVFRGQIGRVDGVVIHRGNLFDGLQWSESEIAEMSSLARAPLVLNSIFTGAREQS